MRSVTAISSMMGKRNKIYRFSMLLIILVTSCISAEHYYIVPNYSTTQCQNYTAGTCFTLEDFASNISHLDLSDHLTLSFLPGEHLLTERLTITGPQNITLTGQNSSNSSMYTIKCQGTSGFEFIDIQSLNIEYLKFTGCGNVSYGGAIYIERTNKVIIKGCHFIDNHVTQYGGAIGLEDTVSTKVEASFFKNNSASDIHGDKIRYRYGGAISIINGSISTINSNYTNNNADGGGGAIVVEHGLISSTSCYYINNIAAYGGAIHVYFGNISSASDQYVNNSAYFGGAIFPFNSSCNLCNDSFKLNRAVDGAALGTIGGVLEISQTNISNNSAKQNHTLNVQLATLTITKEVNFMNNRGSLYITNTQVKIQGAATFMNNEGDFGGAITAVRSQIEFKTVSMVTISNNTATLGGGIYLSQSSLQVYHSFELTDNKASEYGGGIYAFGSEIKFVSEHTQTLQIINNTALNGGAICAIASKIQISNTSVDFNSNRAIMNGGAMYLGQNSNIQLRKIEPDNVRDDLNLSVRLNFTNNSAEKGGAIYVADNTNDGVLYQGANPELHQDRAECFIQTLKVAHFSLPSITYINTFFTNNTAHQSGSDIYGGLLDRCTLNPRAELLHSYPQYNYIRGFDYIKVTTQIEQIIDYSQYYVSHPDYLINNISNSDVLGLISSDGILNFCSDNVISDNHSYSDVLINKGELFKVSVAVVDQVGNPLNATVSSSLCSKSQNAHLKRGQVEQQVGTGKNCTELEYNVYSQDNSAQMHLHLYPEGPCGNIEVSRLLINLTFRPCECHVGFQPSSSETECVCECDRRLTQHQITSWQVLL